MNLSPKRLAIALGVSVVLNLFFVSLFAAHALHGGRHHDRAHGAFFGPWGPMRDGDRATKQAVRRVMKKHEAALHAQGDQLRESRRAISAALDAQPFDPAALEKALADLRAQTSISQELLHKSLVDVAKTLTPEQRNHFARHALRRGLGIGERRHHE